MPAGNQWSRIDNDYLTNRKVRGAGRDGALVHLAAIMYLGAQGIDDGVLPVEAVPLVAAQAWVTKPKPVIAKLVEVGLWHEHRAGYVVHDYDVLNGERSEAVQARRRKARQRDRDRLRSIDGGRSDP